MLEPQNEQFNDWQQVERWMQRLPRFSEVGARAAHFALDQITVLLHAMGNPQRELKVIHVAGTNGKGTVCSTLAAIYTSAGYKTGLYTSPHLIDVRERFRINGELISRDDMVQFFREHGAVIQSFPVTFFELTTALAFWYFAQKKCDLVVVETGLGGRLDATNVVDPLISVITSIGLDHQEQLGNTVGSIAFEKAGIIKLGRPVVLGDMSEEVSSIIHQQRVLKQAPFLQCNVTISAASSEGYFIQSPTRQLFVVPDIQSSYNLSNLRVIAQTVDILHDDFPVTDAHLQVGIAHVRELSGLRGRFERIHPKLNWYFDGAHNEQALQGVLQQVQSMGALSDAVCVFTVMLDKLTPDFIALIGRFGRIFFYESPVARAATLEAVQRLLPQVKEMPDDPSVILESLKSDLVLYTGSFYFYSTVSKWVGSLTQSP